MADPHRGGTCPDGGSPGFMRVVDDGDGLETVICRRDGSWVQQVAATGMAVEYSDYPTPSRADEVVPAATAASATQNPAGCSGNA